MIDTIENTLDELFDTFEIAEVGEDYDLSPRSENTVAIARSRARHWAEINEARRNHGVVAWEGVIEEAFHGVAAEVDPNQKTDALLVLAATALTCAASVQRQTDAFNVEVGSTDEGE